MDKALWLLVCHVIFTGVMVFQIYQIYVFSHEAWVERATVISYKLNFVQRSGRSTQRQHTYNIKYGTLEKSFDMTSKIGDENAVFVAFLPTSPKDAVLVSTATPQFDDFIAERFTGKLAFYSLWFLNLALWLLIGARIRSYSLIK